jgi:hypothetical protein
MGALLLGCGGGDDSEPVTKAEFVKQATALCVTTQKQMQKEINAAFKGGIGDNSEVVAVVEKTVVPGFETEISGIEDLGAPDGEDAQVEAVLAPMQEVVDDAKADPKAFLKSSEKSYEKSEKASIKYGIPACGTPNVPE